MSQGGAWSPERGPVEWAKQEEMGLGAWLAWLLLAVATVLVWLMLAVGAAAFLSQRGILPEWLGPVAGLGPWASDALRGLFGR